MAPPKRRTSKSKRNMRRSHHSRQILKPALSVCPRCGEPKLAHRVCIHCGTYRDREVVHREDG